MGKPSQKPSHTSGCEESSYFALCSYAAQLKLVAQFHRSVSPICRKNSHPVSFEQKHRFDRNRSTYGLLQPLDASKEEAGGKRNADRGSTKPQETWSQGNRAIKATRFYSRCLPSLSRTCVPDLPGVMISGRPSPLRSATRIWSPVPTWPSSIVKR